MRIGQVLRFGPGPTRAAFETATNPPVGPAPARVPVPVQEPRRLYARFVGDHGDPNRPVALYWPISLGGGRYSLNQIVAHVAPGVFGIVLGSFADLVHVQVPGGPDGFAFGRDLRTFWGSA